MESLTTASFAVQSTTTPPYSAELPETLIHPDIEVPDTETPSMGSPEATLYSQDSPKTPSPSRMFSKTTPGSTESPKTTTHPTNYPHTTPFSMQSPGPVSYFIDSPPIPFSLLEKKVTLFYDTHRLQGILHLLPDSQFISLHSRFFDILPTLAPKLTDTHCNPWVLLHSVFGKTWVDRAQLPEPAQTELEDTTKQPTFIALTDSAFFFQSASILGQCDWEGTLSCTSSSNDLIIALDSNQAFSGSRYFVPREKSSPSKSWQRSISVIDFPPRAVHPQLLELVEKMQSAFEEFKNVSNAGIPKKWWIKENLWGHLDARDMLSPTSPLYAHRGNEALFKRKAWLALCFMAGRKNDDGEAVLPPAYCQTLFPDLQARERVEGTVMLKGVDLKWYELEDGDGWEEWDYVGGC